MKNTNNGYAPIPNSQLDALAKTLTFRLPYISWSGRKLHKTVTLDKIGIRGLRNILIQNELCPLNKRIVIRAIEKKAVYNCLNIPCVSRNNY
jgi:hypothetical protein